MTSEAIITQLEVLRATLEQMHKKVDVSSKRIREANHRQFLRRNKKNRRYFKHNPNVAGPKKADSKDIVDDVDLIVDFQVGDFVMVAVPDRPSTHKLAARWRGPYRVTRTINDHVYEVQHLVTENVTEAHVRRMKFYCDAELDMTVPLADHVVAEEGRPYEVEDVCAWRFNKDSMIHEVEIKWLGFSDLENTWEDITVMYEDVPDSVLHFLDHTCSAQDRKKLRAVLGL
jgi:hypothetical protein